MTVIHWLKIEITCSGGTLLVFEVPVLEAEGAVGGQRLCQGVGALMDAMRDLLNNIRPIDPSVENQHGEEEEENDFEDD
ncbi:hypothetical protein CHS0354_018111 [Potamilus streckersoni]|uniref:Uncharacterized protein n=1 Tax=Potamilus streckersoni TaxID=2493646 RepID=A0AAE0ST00_9BIVA|nr:hypothetical protein CHS0354_018111 [Potamilus streckersoni]